MKELLPGGQKRGKKRIIKPSEAGQDGNIKREGQTSKGGKPAGTKEPRTSGGYRTQESYSSTLQDRFSRKRKNEDNRFRTEDSVTSETRSPECKREGSSNMKKTIMRGNRKEEPVPGQGFRDTPGAAESDSGPNKEQMGARRLEQRMNEGTREQRSRKGKTRGGQESSSGGTEGRQPGNGAGDEKKRRRGETLARRNRKRGETTGSIVRGRIKSGSQVRRYKKSEARSGCVSNTRTLTEDRNSTREIKIEQIEMLRNK
ncbi:hypothetical protein C922_05810, partial [Plasmodium inui San Antonio 1]